MCKNIVMVLMKFEVFNIIESIEVVKLIEKDKLV